ncbi:unnamed protein product [Polarella glacialis]|uniref:N-acetyltransferase domain-containing protein n=1 Tax=Polarella glacialis TaxID=89957 RepID=A0A813IT80_POLGL|nr:unnamed protein product [Polarella glacialis]
MARRPWSCALAALLAISYNSSSNNNKSNSNSNNNSSKSNNNKSSNKNSKSSNNNNSKSNNNNNSNKSSKSSNNNSKSNNSSKSNNNNSNNNNSSNNSKSFSPAFTLGRGLPFLREPVARQQALARAWPVRSPRPQPFLTPLWVLAAAGAAGAGAAAALAAAGKPKRSGKEILEGLRQSVGEDVSRGVGFWEELAARTAQAGPEVSVREAASLEEIWGAAQLLSDYEALWRTGREEAPQLSNVLQPFFGLGWIRAMSTVSLRSPLTAIATGEASEGVLGMAQVKKDGYVQNLVVKPGMRRRGIASQVLCWCARKSKERGATRLWMHVEQSNQAALDFYRRLDFEVGPEEQVGSDQHLALRLSRPL